jgi:hypothetical protein
MNTKVCKSCGYVGKPIHDEYSSFIIDLFVWMTVFAISVITGIIPLIILAPVFSIYHLFTFKTKKCPKCRNLDMVSLHSHQGRDVLEPHEGGVQAWSDNRQNPAH